MSASAAAMLAPPVHSAAVIGLGLIGGSIARDLAARGVRVLGHDADASRARAASLAGVLAGELAAGGEPLGALTEAEVVVLAVPVSEAPALLQAVRPYLARARLVTDVGSTKRAVVRAATALGLGARFVGSHPLAGDHRSGWEASRPGLFRGARVFLSPTAESTDDSVALARALWESLGAIPEMIEAAVHDERLAWLSHLPQAASTALALALADAGVPAGVLGSGGRDATRLAASDPAMWAAIAAENADALAPAIAALERRLAALRAAALLGDLEALRGLFAAAQRWATASEKTG